MKKLLYFTLFLIGLQAFSQKKTITFTMVDGKPKAAATATAPKLPVIFSFSEDFSGKAVNLTQDNKVIALRNAKFGDSELSKDGETGTYKILIDKNGIVNPGNGKVKAGSFKLNVDGASFEIKPQTESAPARTGNTARTGDGGESAEEEEPSPSARESTNYDPGYIYYDALSLVGNDVDGGTKAMILKAYDIDGTNIDENPYLDNAIDFDNLVEGGSAASLLSNLGGMDVTYFAAGLARFLAERTKEELNEAFFRKMKDQLNTYPELTTLFPQTTSYLNNIETYSYAAIEQLLKEAFETDIRNLPENLYELKNLTKAACNNEFLKDPKKIAKCQARMDNIEAFFDSRNGHWTGLGMFTLKEAIGSGNPADLLKLVTESTELEELKVFSESGSLYTDLNVASAIELANLLSQSLISKDEGQVWVNSNQITKLLKTKNALMVYLGLLIQRQKVDHSFITFYKGDGTKVAFNDFWINGYADYAIYEPQLKSIIKDAATAFTAANSAVRKIAAAVDNSTQADPQSLYNYYRTFSASIKTIAHSELIKTISTTTDIAGLYDQVEKLINPAVDMAYHLSVKKYSAAVYDASIVISGLKGDDDFKPVAKSFLKYGTLISTVASAESSDEVKKAIAASVLPAGSSSIKRNTAYSISLNAYVGGFYGKAYTHTEETVFNELNEPVSVKKAHTSYTTYGLYAPIGVAFNLGSKSGWGGSVIVQMLDLGALVNFYLTKGDETALPDDFNVRLSNIFAPGAQLALNIPKTPLSILVGGQFVPALFKTQQITENAEITASNAWRLQASLVVDLPLYNLKVWDFSK